MGWFSVSVTTGLVLFTTIGYLFNTVYTHRRKFNELRKQGVPMPQGWSWVTGHLHVLQKYLDKVPPDAAVAFAMRDLAQEYGHTELFLMDFWPVYPPLYTMFGPGPISQICNKYNLPKTATAFRTMKPVAGGPNLLTMNGDEWKRWRALFNPGFSAAAMLNNVPHIVDSALVFREKLVERIGTGMFSLHELTTKLTTEIILKVTLNLDSNHQRSSNVIITALNKILSWHSFWDPRVLLNPLRPFIQRYNGYLIKKNIHQELEKRFQEIKDATLLDGAARQSPQSIKSVMTMALEAYLSERGEASVSHDEKLDRTFADYASYQIRIFLFAGTDTTASMMVYVYHYLSKHSDWLRRLRGEHDQLFGPDPKHAAIHLKQNPVLLNQCKLTVAFIKETLRLRAPAGTLRSGLSGVTITDLQGNEQPMDFGGANILHQALHVNPRVWPRPMEFLPERFLVEPGHELYPDPAAFRPFEQGPRNCIGQTLVWNELKIAIILTCRDLEIRDAYDDFDAKVQREMGFGEKCKRKLLGDPLMTVHGERAYQTDSGGLHPVSGYPCYVQWANDRSGQQYS